MGYFTTEQVQDIVNGFMEAEVWVGLAFLDDDTPPADDYIDMNDLTADVREDMEATVRDFVAYVDATVSEAHVSEYMEAVGGDPVRFGHDFALTRQGHGAGYWDRGAGEAGEALTDAAKAFPGDGLHVYVDSDDGVVGMEWG